MYDKNPINGQGLTEEQLFSMYNPKIYDKPDLSADVVMFTILDQEKENYRKLPGKSFKIYLKKRVDQPFVGQWALPGALVSAKESIDGAALKIVKAETNTDKSFMEQLYTFGAVKRDPRTRTVSCSYLALVDNSTLNLGSDDVTGASWFDIKYIVEEEKKTKTEKGVSIEKIVKLSLTNADETLAGLVKVIDTYEDRTWRTERHIMESDGIAFDHLKMIQYAIDRLRNKIEHTDIAFNLVPELFTLSELQQVYEIILDKELLAAAFRRKIADMVIETDQYTKDAGHRPSKFYRFNPEWRV